MGTQCVAGQGAFLRFGSRREAGRSRAVAQPEAYSTHIIIITSDADGQFALFAGGIHESAVAGDVLARAGIAAWAGA